MYLADFFILEWEGAETDDRGPVRARHWMKRCLGFFAWCVHHYHKVNMNDARLFSLVDTVMKKIFKSAKWKLYKPKQAATISAENEAET